MDFKIILNDVEHSVLVTHKKMKKVRLKVFPDGTVKLSVPMDTPDEWIDSYIKSKTSWILEKITIFKQTRAVEKEEHFISGASTRILGRQLSIQLHESNKKRIEIEDSILHVYTCEKEQDRIDAQVNNWWQKQAKVYYLKVIESLCPIIEKHGISKPEVRVKKMKTLWGSCSRKTGKINLNYYLFKASVPCVEYVILHELTHFLYPYHNKDFYDFITIHMPDWKDRKKQLDYEFVLGI